MCGGGDDDAHRRPSLPRRPRTAPSPKRSSGTLPAPGTRRRRSTLSWKTREHHSGGRTPPPAGSHKRRVHAMPLRRRNTVRQLRKPCRRSTSRLARYQRRWWRDCSRPGLRCAPSATASGRPRRRRTTTRGRSRNGQPLRSARRVPRAGVRQSDSGPDRKAQPRLRSRARTHRATRA